MEIKFNDDNLKKFQHNLDAIRQDRFSLRDLFPDDFIRQHTDFDSLQAMVDACSIKAIEEQTDEFIKFIYPHIRSGTWGEMLKTAQGLLLKRKLGL